MTFVLVVEDDRRMRDFFAASVSRCKDLTLLASIEAGALGHIHKDSTPEDIAQTILELRAGGSPISPLIARLEKLNVHTVQGHIKSIYTKLSV